MREMRLHLYKFLIKIFFESGTILKLLKFQVNCISFYTITIPVRKFAISHDSPYYLIHQ